MPDGFQRVGQSLRNDRGLRSGLATVAALLLLLAWVAWAFRTNLPLLVGAH